MAKKQFPETHDQLRTRQETVLRELFDESDRGCVLVGVTCLDEALEQLIRAKMSCDKAKIKSCIAPLFEGRGPLASFWAKIMLSSSLDLIEEWVFRDLEIIRNIRNRFAHSYLKADFDDPSCVRLTENLKGADFAVTALEAKKPITPSSSSSLTSPAQSKPAQKRKKKERIRFSFTVSYIAGHIEAKLKKAIF